MSRILRIALFLTAATGLVAQGARKIPYLPRDTWEEHRQWIGSVLQSVATIKPGMTRTDVLRLFSEEGGLSTRTQRTYVYQQCPYIKIDITFSPSSNSTSSAEMPDDVVVNLSRPYLQYTIAD